MLDLKSALPAGLARLMAGAVGLAVGCALAAPAAAATVYTYAGQAFTSITDTPGTTGSFGGHRVTGWFETDAPLAGNLSGTTPALLDFSFTDGLSTLTMASTSEVRAFRVATDAAGAITEWQIMLFRDFSPVAIGSLQSEITTLNRGVAYDVGYLVQCQAIAGPFCGGTSDEGRVDDHPGVWSVADAPVATPLPPALTLFAAGAGLLALLARRRKRSSDLDVAC